MPPSFPPSCRQTTRPASDPEKSYTIERACERASVHPSSAELSGRQQLKNGRPNCTRALCSAPPAQTAAADGSGGGTTHAPTDGHTERAEDGRAREKRTVFRKGKRGPRGKDSRPKMVSGPYRDLARGMLDHLCAEVWEASLYSVMERASSGIGLLVL